MEIHNLANQEDFLVIDGEDQIKTGKDHEEYPPRNYVNSKTHEKEIVLPKGIYLFISLLILAFLCIPSIIYLGVFEMPQFIPIPALILIVSVFFLAGFRCAGPNEGRVITYCGNYVGTSKQVGFLMQKPCQCETIVSLKSEYFNGNMIKVNERGGNPVLLGCIAIWKVKDTAKVIFDVNDYKGFVRTQTESAVRYVGCKYPYEPMKEGEPSLRGGEEIINHALKEELERRVEQAGIEIEDARITEISLGPEVASLMLKKQAAQFVVDAKLQIVRGAVNSVDESLRLLDQKKVCNFSQDEKNKYASNMMLVLCMENNSTPLVKLS